jgi:Holliday junction resolvase RusA-like endonuclease
MEVKGTVFGNTPSKSNCYKIITIGSGFKKHSSLAKTKAMKEYENSFYMQVGKCRGKMITDYFNFEIDVYYPSNRSDLDNSLKVVLDCLQKAEVIKNDNKCTQIIARKFIDKINPRIEFKIILAMKE